MSNLFTYLGDDFTGSSDVLLQYARAGRSGVLFLTMPSETELASAASAYSTIGVASVIRSLRPADMEPVVREAFELFRGLNPRVVQYKICSTGDSSPTMGSIEPATTLGRKYFGNDPVAILAAQEGLGRYTVFGNHFARSTNGTVARLDRHPMASHPSTPMDEADLRRHFARQLGGEVGLLDLLSLRNGRGPDVVRELRERGVAAYVVDAIDGSDLETAAGVMLSESPETLFAIGSGGLSVGLARALPLPGGASLAAPKEPGRCLVVSGSASLQTSAQISRAAERGWTIIDVPAELLGDQPEKAALSRLFGSAAEALAGERGVVVCTSRTGTRRETSVSPARVGRVLGELITYCRQQGNLGRVVVAGGDTSGYVLRTLRARTLSALGPIGPDLLLGSITSEDPSLDSMEVVLKGGQLGGLDVFHEVCGGGAGTSSPAGEG